MRKFCLGAMGIATCVALPLCADCFCEADDAYIAGKDFPFPPDESVLPQNTPEEEDDDYDYPYQNRPRNQQKPGANPNRPNSGKDIFPPEEERRISPEVNSNRPNAGKDIFPPEED